MKSPYICSYIIPYIHSPKNLKLLRSILEVLNRDTRIQKIIVETGTTSVLKNLDLKGDFIFVESSGWNVGWLFNCGSKIAKSENLFFGSFEYLPRIEVISSVLANPADQRQCVYLQDSLIELSKEQTDNRQLDPKLPEIKLAYEGIVFYTRDGFFMAGGWDENVYNKDLYVIQDKRNKCSVNVGQVNGALTFKTTVDLPIISETLTTYSTNHLNKVLNLDRDSTVNYLSSQSRRNGNYNKYLDKNIMEV
jgi:hypothetical protein